MRLIWSWVLALSLAAGCGGSEEGEPVTQAETQAAGAEEPASEEPAPEEPDGPGIASGPSAGMGTELAESGAQAAARRAAEAGGYSMDQHSISATRREGDEYAVDFVQGPPTPPGGHFTVYVNARSGGTRIEHGE